MRTLLLAVFVAGTVGALTVLPGCEKREEVDSSPIQQPQFDLILSTVFDMSGSFADLIEKKGYRYFMGMSDRFFRDRIGSNDRLIISQLSAVRKSLLWDGSPRSLKHDFPNAKAFKDFLLKSSDPGGSRVHDAVADAVEYLTTYPGVKEGKTRTAIFVFSDMFDNAPDQEATKTRLTTALAEYAKVKGAVGLYWCEQSLVSEWRRNLQQAGLSNYVVESEIVADPALPTFE